jgi:hypothetical protein
MRIMREVDGTGVELRLRKRLGRRSTGEIIELDANGFVVSSIKILPGIGIIGLFCHVVQKEWGRCLDESLRNYTDHYTYRID